MTLNYLSNVLEPAILRSMETGIGAFVRRRRDELGLIQRELAERAGVTKGYLSTLEADKIGLPAPDVRRRLAKALGVSHLDLLIAAHEISEDEIGAAGAVGVVEREADDLRAQLHRAVDAVPDWESAPNMARSLIEIMAGIRFDQTGAANRVIERPLANSEPGLR